MRISALIGLPEKFLREMNKRPLATWDVPSNARWKRPGERSMYDAMGIDEVKKRAGFCVSESI